MQRPPTDPAAQLQWLVDRAAISDVQAAYGRCLDDRDFGGWQNLFTTDAVLHMPFETIPQADLAAAAQRILERYPMTQHLLGQSYIEVKGDTAIGRRYLAAVHSATPKPAKEHADLGGWYDQEFRRTPDGWKFTDVRAKFIWLAGEDFLT